MATGETRFVMRPGPGRRFDPGTDLAPAVHAGKACFFDAGTGRTIAFGIDAAGGRA